MTLRNLKRSALIVVAAWLLLSGASPLQAATTPDPWITAKIKVALLTAEEVSGTDVNVDTVDGRVTLHGKVSSEAAKQKAAQVARDIDGVKEVQNLLQVVPAKAREQVEVADDALKQRVSKALQAESALKDSEIAVASVNDGVVLLSGDANSVADHLLAIQIVQDVEGVRRVGTEIQSPDPLHDAEIRAEKMDRKDDAADAGSLSAKVSSAISDARITAATKMRLLADADTPALAINVDTRRGVVTLFGRVSSEAAKKAAELHARKVSGVKDVRNQLEVVPEVAQEAVEVRDEHLQTQIEKALRQQTQLDNADIDVAVTNGVARLTGTVQSEEQRLSAAIAARSVEGVRSVNNDLRVGQKRHSMR